MGVEGYEGELFGDRRDGTGIYYYADGSMCALHPNIYIYIYLFIYVYLYDIYI